MNKLTDQIRREVKEMAEEDSQYGLPENDFDYMKRILAEEYPELDDNELNEITTIYFNY